MDHTSQPTAPPRPATPDLTGKTLGDFHILRRLGEGGMGQVYLAEQLSLKRKVALKLLRPDMAVSDTLKRFKAEAEAVARATHANIVQVYAIGETGGLHYMALEYVEGRNLREYVEKKGPPEVLVALSIMRQVASALQRASELGVVHRDIKPENILLTRKGEVKVADFGLSRVFAEDYTPLNLTQSGVAMGTPLYMSPEQVEGRPVDPRSDIYSFGVTCYHMFAGQPPFRGQSAFEVALQHVQKEAQPLAEIRPDLPAELCALVHKMMAKRPDDRCQTGRDVVKEVGRLRDLIVGVGNAAVTNLGSSSLVSMGPGPGSSADALATQSLPSLQRRRRWPWMLAASLMLATGAGLAAGYFYFRDLPRPTEAAAAEFAGAVKPALGERKEREEHLLKLIQECGSTAVIDEERAGAKFAIELGMLYLKDRERLDEADRFFRELGTNPNYKNKMYKPVSQLGQAMVLAFQDRPKESNEAFQKALFKSPAGKGPLPVAKGYLSNPELREMVARALNYNHANAPAAFPKMLEHLRFPPAPPPKTALKAP